jgi:hypothetical protein
MDKKVVVVINYTQKIDFSMTVKTMEEAEALAKETLQKFKGDDLIVQIYDKRDYYKGFDCLLEFKSDDKLQSNWFFNL